MTYTRMARFWSASLIDFDCWLSVDRMANSHFHATCIFPFFPTPLAQKLITVIVIASTRSHCVPILWIKWGVGLVPPDGVHTKIYPVKRHKKKWTKSEQLLPLVSICRLAGKPIYQSLWSRWMKLFCCWMQFSVK